MGHLATGIDKVKEAKLRKVDGPPLCRKCVYQRSKCYVHMYHKYGKFGVNPPENGMLWERVMLEITQELWGVPINPWYACHPPEVQVK